MTKRALVLLLLATSLVTGCGGPDEKTMILKCGQYRQDWREAVLKGESSKADAIMTAYKQDGCEEFIDNYNKTHPTTS
jgi:major membrane immunogen (membrane-anchored lipoprotein)